jgi:bifunctional non-homologous end joining protein LigD
MRGLISPMLATLVAEPVNRRGWVYEEKYDGDRAIAYRRRRRVRVYSRNLKDITADFDGVARAVAALPGGDLVLDGEIVIFDHHDVSRFQLLQRRAMGEPLRPVFAIFDCLARDGVRLLRRPLAERRRALEAVIPAGRNVLMRSRRLPGDGFRAYRTAQAHGWEGIIAKNDASPYEPGRRSRSWLKVKCRKESEFVIGGYTAPAGRRRHLGALLVGLYDDGALRYVGKVGAGFSDQTLDDLARKLKPLRVAAPAFRPVPQGSGPTWVRPTLVAQIAFAEWTADGKLRQPAFLGLRTDKPPAECRWSERER